VSATVRVEPSGITLELHDGETVMAAARRAGYRWPTICGGLADCGACALEVLEGGAALPTPTRIESVRLDALVERRRYPNRTYRLACQLVPTANVVVRKTGVVPDDPRRAARRLP
jgi:2Fe-2S ferredoxin